MEEGLNMSLYSRAQSLVDPRTQAHPQQYSNSGYINGLEGQQCFPSCQTQTRLAFPQQENFSNSYNDVTEFNSTSGGHRSSSFFGHGYDGEEVGREQYSRTLGLRKATGMPDYYDSSSFYIQASVEASGTLYSRRSDVTTQNSVAVNRLEYKATENDHLYQDLHGNRSQASHWLAEETGETPPLQSSASISSSQITQEEDWCADMRRNSASSMGSDELCPSLDSGDTDDKDRSFQNRVLPPCRICGARASGFHYGVNSCEACKGFFRRALKRPITFHCTKDNTCNIKGNRRSTCRFCRYKRCLRLGMSRDAIKTGRYSHRKRTSDIIEVKQLENTPGFPVDEPDFDNVLDTLMAAHDAQESLAASKETEAAIYLHQRKQILFHGLGKTGREDDEPAMPATKSSEKDKSGISRALTKDTPIADSSCSRYVHTITNNSSSNKSEGGRLHDFNNSCSNSNASGGYPDSGAASPSLSSTSNDSGFNEDGLSPRDVSEKGKIGFAWHEPLDLSRKRKREGEDEEEEEEKSGSRQKVAHVKPSDSESSLTSLQQVDFHSDLTEVSSSQESRPASRTRVTIHDIADQLVHSLCTDDPSTVRLLEGFLEDSDSSCHSTNYAPTPRKCGGTDDSPEDSSDQKLPDCFLAKSRFFGQQDDHRSVHFEQHWTTEDIGQCTSGLRDERDSDIDLDTANDVRNRSGLERSTAKGCYDDATLGEPTRHEAAKKWVTGYINFANAIPGWWNRFSSYRPKDLWS